MDKTGPGGGALSLSDNPSERQIDSGAKRTGRLGHGVQPILLSLALHDQHAAMWQRDTKSPALSSLPPMWFRFESQLPYLTQIDRRDHRLRPQRRLIIGMPAHGILSVAIQIPEHAVKTCAT